MEDCEERILDLECVSKFISLIFWISAASSGLSVSFLVLYPFDMCREGCTAEFFKCHQVRVTYTPELSWQEDVSMEQIDQQEWAHLHRLDRKVSKHSHLVIPSLVTTVQPTELVPRQSQIKRAARPCWWRTLRCWSTSRVRHGCWRVHSILLLLCGLTHLGVSGT